MCVYFTCGYMFVIVGVFRGQRHCTPVHMVALLEIGAGILTTVF